MQASSSLRFMPRAVAVKRVASTVAAPTPRASPEPSVPLLESSPSTITATSVAVTLVPVGSPAPLPVEPVVESVSVVPPVAEAPAADENVAQMSRPEKRSRCDSPSSASSKEGGASAALSVFSDVPSPVLLPAHAAGGVSSLVTTPSGASSSPAVGVPPSNKVQDADDMFSDDVFAAIPILTPPVAAAGDSVERRANGGWAIAPLSGPAPLEPEDGWDDGEGYYKPSIGELIAGRYRVTECVGQGMFACVVRAVDTQGGRSVAVKIIRANDMMTRAAEKEAALCRRLADADPGDRKRCVRLLDTVVHRRHACLVFEALECDLRKLNKMVGAGVGLSLHATRSFGRQLLVALRHLHACEHVHADVKPDNILVGGEKRTLLKLCDFGTAVPLWELADFKATRYMQARYYRSPEVLLGLTRSPGMDIWSAGCVLFELFTGGFAFAGPSNLELLRAMQSCLGPIPSKLLRSAPFRDTFYTPGRDVLLPPAAGEDGSGPAIVGPGLSDIKSRLISAAIKGKVRAVKAKHPRNLAKIEASRSLTEAEKAEVACLSDLLEKMFAYDPTKRLTAEQALKHEFFREDAPRQVGKL